MVDCLRLGQCIVKWTTKGHTYPVHMGAYNHRAEAFYRCQESFPDNGNVQLAAARGLVGVTCLSHKTPDVVFAKAIRILNEFHGGSGASVLDYFQEATDLEASWKADCFSSGLTSANPKYASLYEDFVVKKVPAMQCT